MIFILSFCVVREVQTKMNILDVPKEVVEGILFPFLKVNDILRFRRICKHTKLIADNYLRLFGHKLFGEIIIDHKQHGRSLENFMNTGFSLSKVSLKMDLPEDLASKTHLEFMEKHGSQIKELKISKLFCCDTRDEFNFYSALPNLASLEIDTVFITTWRNHAYPENLRSSLKTLKINEVLSGDNVLLRYTDCDRVENSLTGLYDNVEYFKHPLYRNRVSVMIIMTMKVDSIFSNFSVHHLYPSLKAYDLSSFNFDRRFQHPLTIFGFINLFMPFVIEKGIKLMGVDCKCLNALNIGNFDELNNVGRCLQTIRNVNALVFLCEDVPFLEEIDIISSAKCTIPDDLVLDNGPVPPANRWPLKKLLIQVDSASLKLEPSGLITPIRSLYNQFFGGRVILQHLTELAVIFEEFEIYGEEEPDVCPAAEAIVTSCPNLKRLKLKNWPGTNEDLCQLWSQLQNLEQVCLEDCKEIGDAAFVGVDNENPVFFKLKKLKKLELINVDNMPQITDACFSLVFRHMKLTHFFIKSKDPIKNVSPVGIRALLTGDFANSIVKFPFNGWSMLGVSGKVFRKLADKFRSSHMT